MARVTQAHVDARIRDIADAAYRVVARRGFAGATMQEIAEEAGVSAGTLYNYFESKEDIIAGIAGQVRDRRRAELQAGAIAATPREDFEATTRAVFDRLRKPEEFYNFIVLVNLWAEATRSPRIASTLQGTIKYVADAATRRWQQARDAGEIASDVDPRALAHIMIALREGLIVQLGAGVQIDIDAYAHAVTSLLVGRLWTDSAGGSRDRKEP